ncbi:hypothetical protein MXB_3962, partial [Myxobolus squamalis]
VNPILRNFLNRGVTILFQSFKKAYEKEANVWKMNRSRVVAHNQSINNKFAPTEEMSPIEAQNILNINESEINRNTIYSAYKKHLEANSPEKGGSPFLRKKFIVHLVHQKINQ